VGQGIAGLLAGAGLLYDDYLRDEQRKFKPRKKMIKLDQEPNNKKK
jgi:hypothetical protein